MSGSVWTKASKFEIINLVGSIASIIGFAILILTMISANSNRSPEVLVWQYIFFLMSTIVTSCVVVIFYFWILDGITTGRSTKRIIIGSTCKLLIGLLLVGVGFDAIISSIYWTWWMGVPFDMAWQALASTKAATGR